MNKLSTEKCVTILNKLVEGMSMRAITRVTGASINTVTKLLGDAADAAIAYHAERVRGIAGYRHLQCDEIWAFVYAKQGTVRHTQSTLDRARRYLDLHGPGHR